MTDEATENSEDGAQPVLGPGGVLLSLLVENPQGEGRQLRWKEGPAPAPREGQLMGTLLG